MAMKYKVGDLCYKKNAVTRHRLKVKVVNVTGTDIYYRIVNPETNQLWDWDIANPIRLEHKDERLLTPISKLERYLEGMDNEDAS